MNCPLSELLSIKRPRIPGWLSIERIDAELTMDEYVLNVKFKNNPDSKWPYRYIYDRNTKRYYVVVFKEKYPHKAIKKRVSENDFHALFNLYLEGDTE